MIVGFDLDGVLDREVLSRLALKLINTGNEVHIITGYFAEAGAWQDRAAKFSKLMRLGIPFTTPGGPVPDGFHATLHVLEAADESYDRDYRLADIRLRKGDLCFKYSIELYFDDNPIYCEMIPRMSGDTTVVHVR